MNCGMMLVLTRARAERYQSRKPDQDYNNSGYAAKCPVRFKSIQLLRGCAYCQYGWQSA